MDLTTFGMAGVAAITVICYLAATAVKQTPLANKWLPTICGTLGGVLGVLAWCGSVPDFPAGDPLTALAVGIGFRPRGNRYQPADPPAETAGIK